MLVLNCGCYEEAQNDVNKRFLLNDRERALTLVGNVTVTPKQWSKLGADYMEEQMELSLTLPPTLITNVFCNSDHFLNGIRVVVKESEIAEEDVAKFVLVRFYPGDGRAPIEIKMNKKGRMERWPEGFFDQLESDLARL